MNALISFWIQILLLQRVFAFIQCPSNGIQQCSSSEAPYYITNVDNLVISNCVFLGCPQILISASNVTIQNCTFDANGIKNTVIFDMGAALYITPDIYAVRPTKIFITHSSFKNYQTVSYGGAIYIGSALTEPALFVNTLFYQNQASQDGGALKILSCPVIMINCIIDKNTAGDYGGAFLTKGSYTIFEGCTITNNFGWFGGAIYKETSDGFTINNCVFTGNSCNSFGGAIFLSSSTGDFILTNSVFADGFTNWYGSGCYFESVDSIHIENITTTNMWSWKNGGSFYLFFVNSASFRNISFIGSYAGDSDGGGAIGTYLNGNVTVENCQFIFCQGIHGGGIAFKNYNSPTSATIRNCQFIGNSCTGLGGAIKSDGNSLDIYNCTFLGNSGATGGTIHAIGPNIFVNIRDSIFQNSQASVIGGTISIDGLVSVNVQNTVILNSTSSGSAGTFYLKGPLLSPAIFTDVFISGSSAKNQGGTFYFDADASFSCFNCQITNSAASNGGFIYAVGPTTRLSTLTNSQIKNCQTNSSGGFIALKTSFQINVSNCTFTTGTSAFGGAFNIALKSVLNITNCNVFNSTSMDTGGLLYSTGKSMFSIADSIVNGVISYNDAVIAYASTGAINFARCSLINIQLLGAGSYFSLETSSLNLDILSITNGPSLLYVKLQSTVNIGRLTSVNCQGTNLDGSLISCYQGSNIILGSGSSISGFQGSVILALFSKSKVQLSGASFLQNIPTSYGFRVSEGSTLNFQSSQMVGGIVATEYSPIYLDAGSTVNCIDSQITGNYFGGCGTVYVGTSSVFNASNCAIMGNNFFAQSLTCDAESQVLNGFGGGICCDGQAILSNGATISNNSAINGGAIYVGPSASVLVNSGVTISNNKASSSGGAFYFGGAEMQIDSKGVTVTGNAVLNSGNTSSSSLAYFGGLSDGVITLASLTTSNMPASVISGGILVEHPDAAFKTLSLGLVSSLPNTVTWTGRASYLRVLNRDEFIANARALNLSQSLPSIVVATYDYFGNQASFDPNAIVSVQLSEVTQSSPLSGDVIKSILDANTGTLSFDNVQLPQRLPGSYVISVSAVQGTIKALPTNDSSISSLNLLSVTFTPCGAGLRLVPSVHACFPMLFLSKSFRIAISVISIIGLVYSIYCLTQLFQLKEHEQMKKTVHNFKLLIVQITGISISLLSLFFEIIPISVFCGISLWLENIGFALVLFSLSFATVEILLGIKDEKEKNIASANSISKIARTNEMATSNTEPYKFSPRSLKIFGAAILGCLFVFLAIWTFIDPLQFRDVFYPANKVVLIDKCSSLSNIFFIVLQAIKLLAAVITAYLSLRIEKRKKASMRSFYKSQARMQFQLHLQTKESHDKGVPNSSQSDQSSQAFQLEESELLSVCSYNWVVFGPVISLIAEKSISDPDTGFFFAKLSVLVPSLLTLFIMANSRIYLCSQN